MRFDSTGKHGVLRLQRNVCYIFFGLEKFQYPDLLANSRHPTEQNSSSKLCPDSIAHKNVYFINIYYISPNVIVIYSYWFQIKIQYNPKAYMYVDTEHIRVWTPTESLY